MINNAGVALAGSFTDLTLEEFDWLMEINFRAVLTLTHALVPVLLQHPGSHLVNLSSVFGLIAPPEQTAYVTSKFAVRGLTESLRAELLGRVGVTCVHPGGIATRIAVDARVSEGADRAEIERGLSTISGLLRIPASVAAESILNGVRRRRPRVLIGLTARLPDLLARVAPGSYGRMLVHRVHGGPSSREARVDDDDDRTGRPASDRPLDRRRCGRRRRTGRRRLDRAGRVRRSTRRGNVRSTCCAVASRSAHGRGTGATSRSPPTASPRRS